MKLSLLALSFAAVAAAATCGGHGTRETLVVSPEWLSSHLKDSNLVVLAIGDRKAYDSGHIPGAQYFEYKDAGEKSAAGLTLELPPMARLAEVFGKYGITNASR